MTDPQTEQVEAQPLVFTCTAEATVTRADGTTRDED